jgi:hypothetical protein
MEFSRNLRVAWKHDASLQGSDERLRLWLFNYTLWRMAHHGHAEGVGFAGRRDSGRPVSMIFLRLFG